MLRPLIAACALTFFLMASASAQNRNPVSRLEVLSEPAGTPQPGLSDYRSGRIGTQNVLSKWTPTGALQTPVSPDCHPRQFEDTYLSSNGTESDKRQILTDYFNRCGKFLSRDAPRRFTAMLRLDKARYDIFANPHIQPIRLHFANGETVTGFLGLKPDNRPHPFVVVRCGVTCQADNSASVRNLTSHLFDESPFNILFLASHTSTPNAQENHRLAFGGHYEAQEMYEVGKWVRFAAPFRHLVGSVHAAGISLGGHAALYTALYNDYNPISDDLKVFNSVVAYCPVVNLEDTMRSLFDGGGVTDGFMRDSFWTTLQDVYDQVPDLHDLMVKGQRPSNPEMMQIIGTAATRFSSRIPAGTALFPFRDKPIRNLGDLWSLNKFTNQAKGITTPTLVWSAQDDSVVDYSFNGEVLTQQFPNADKSRLVILNTPQGNHCAQAITYGWETTATVLRTFIMDHSFDVYIKREKVTYPLAITTPPLGRGEQHMLQEWKASRGSDELELKFTVFNNQFNCKKPGESSPSCYNTYLSRVKMSSLPIPLAPPATGLDAEILTRWLNSRLELHGPSGRLIQSREGASQLVVVQD